MEDYIIINLHLFDMKQDVSIYQQGKKVAYYTTTIELAKEMVPVLCFKYGITNVKLCGNKEYLSKFKTEITKFTDNHNINISIVEK